MIKAIQRKFDLFDFNLHRAEFYGDLAEMFERGESMLSFLEGEIQNASRTGMRSRAVALRLMLARYQSGAEGGRLEYLLNGIVPSSDALMLLAVERANSKPAALRSMKRTIEQQDEMRRIVVVASALPIVVILLCSVLIWTVAGLLRKVDQNAPVYVRDAIWTGFNGLAKWIADISIDYGPALMVVTAIGLMALVHSLPRWKGAWRLRAEQLPVYSLYRDYQAGLLCSSIAMLLQAGGTLRGSIEDLALRASPVLRWHLGRVLQSLDDAPNRAVEAFSRGVFSPYMVARASTLYRSTGKDKTFSDVLVQLGTSEGDRLVGRVRLAAILAGSSVTGVFATAAVILGIASVTAVGKFSNVMQPAAMMAAKAEYEAAHPIDAPDPVLPSNP
ncbi:hypothetical protein QRD43_20825 [Pelomonas sp. APW6]|uniref:Type II secretion system protein GspF domain-containing protein n=1 Tax=Roseateles subflavus TaxID=3053353 RepID=A0ABT7LPH7_9BURK|nr:hypothetical protein [Pelomonas sp. APW6]MDL5034359.1 hypothetical protein [Pelomonas sp. APW6]